MIPIDAKVIERFWERVVKGDGEDACWEWSGSRMPHGYGAMGIKNTTYRAHRVSWEIANGPIDGYLFVCHRCDNPPCVRPDHLFLGTNADNTADRDAKGRQVTPLGERHGSARLTAENVAEIRASHDSITVLARRFSVDPSTVRDVLRGKTWVAPIDERRLAGAWLRALGRDHDEKCLVDDGTGGCPVGAEIADLVPKVIREYQRLSDTGDTPDGAS